MPEIEKVEVDKGVVVSLPLDRKAFLVSEHPIKGLVIEPLEKIPTEEIIAGLLKDLFARKKTEIKEVGLKSD